MDKLRGAKPDLEVVYCLLFMLCYFHGLYKSMDCFLTSLSFHFFRLDWSCLVTDFSKSEKIAFLMQRGYIHVRQLQKLCSRWFLHRCSRITEDYNQQVNAITSRLFRILLCPLPGYWEKRPYVKIHNAWCFTWVYCGWKRLKEAKYLNQ